MERLEAWLANPDPEAYPSAVSAAVTIAFLTHNKTSSLLALARDHPSSDVQLEAAWALARRGKPQGIRDLVAATHDWKTCEKAVRYLEELGLRDEIPPGARDPKHAALSTIANWLADPNELAAYPDSVSLVDQREIVWPPTGERTLLSQVRWILADDEGICLTGSINWCLRGEKSRKLGVLGLSPITVIGNCSARATPVLRRIVPIWRSDAHSSRNPIRGWIGPPPNSRHSEYCVATIFGHRGLYPNH